MAEGLSGIIDRVVFHNPDTGFAVLRVEVAGHKEPLTVVGQAPQVVAGEYLQAEGQWVHDPEHGRQFKADTIRTSPPHSVEGIEKFLGSGLVKGIGPHFARKIVEVFGERTLAVIDESPSFLREVKGIGARRIQRIRDSWKQQQAVRQIMLFLQSHGLGTTRALRIWKTYGEQALDRVRQNPYRLATDIWGIGFQTADRLAQNIGIDRQSPLRARAALAYVLKELSDQGHCGYPEAEVRRRTAALTGIEPGVIAEAVEHEVQAGNLVRDPPAKSAESAQANGPAESWLYLRPLYLAEVGVAQSLRRLQHGPHPLPALQVEAALDWVQQRIGLELAPSQRDAIRQATQHKVLVITGGPGVGKTTIVRAILDIFEAKKRRCVLCAPTGRAAKRLGETTGREARTIHRLLEFDAAGSGFKRNHERPLPLDLLVVDEASMVDLPLMNALLRAVPPAACLLLVGDVDQLPSVGPGTVLADILASGAVPVVRLREIFRQAQHSWIVRAAHRVNHGELPESAPAGEGDFYFVAAETPDAIRQRIVTLVHDRIPARFGLDPFQDVQVLTPMNRSELGSRNLNIRLQEVFNPPRDDLPQVERHGWCFRLGDKVLQTQNDYPKDVFNGDIGRIREINLHEQELIVDFDGRKVAYDFGELDELSLAYALTIHKSQGSEYPAVVIPLHTQHWLLLQRNLLYTGITRGKQVVVLVGSPKALAAAVRRADTSRRYSRLSQRLEHG